MNKIKGDEMALQVQVLISAQGEEFPHAKKGRFKVMLKILLASSSGFFCLKEVLVLKSRTVPARLKQFGLHVLEFWMQYLNKPH